MKIAFICPRISEISQRTFNDVPEEIKEIIQKYPLFQRNLESMKRGFCALGLLTVAATVPKDIEVEFIDQNMEEIDYSKPYDLVAISGNLDQLNQALDISDHFLQRKVPVVAGGTAVISFPDLYTRKGITIIDGEGEDLFPIFLKDFKNHNTRKVYDETVGKAHVDLEDSPIPCFDLAAKYNYSMIGMQVTRGCPHNCSFCQEARIFGRKTRLKPIPNVIQEIKLIKKYWPNSFFFFYDDNPFINKKYAMELFDTLFNKENIDLGKWGASADVTLAQQEDLMRLLTSKGPMSYLGIGFEALAETTLSQLNNSIKLNNADMYREIIQTFKKFHINPVGYFIVGFRTNTIKELEDIVEFVRDTRIAAEVGRLTLLPGTILYDNLKKEYETQFGKLNTFSSLAEWGRLNKYLKEQSIISDKEIQYHLAEIFKIVYSHTEFLEKYMDDNIPYCIHF
ncbi:MAG: B12-binding domain-containing radical SAM protein [Spirochaetales bacterium]|nr:B12-binding domain-containing radical SAM protein [Spirochaetales bacterium]